MLSLSTGVNTALWVLDTSTLGPFSQRPFRAFALPESPAIYTSHTDYRDTAPIFSGAINRIIYARPMSRFYPRYPPTDTLS